MIETLSYPSEIYKMSHFTDGDLFASVSASDSPSVSSSFLSSSLDPSSLMPPPPNTTAQSSSFPTIPSSYCLTDSYLTPPMAYVTDPSTLSISHTPPPPDYSRPRSSSGHFIAQNENYLYPRDDGLRIGGVEDLSFPPSPFGTADSPLPTPAFSTGYSSPLPNVARPMTRTPSVRSIHHVPIAPHPSGLQKPRPNAQISSSVGTKRMRDDDMPSSEAISKRRRRSTTPMVPTVELNEEERLLLKLKDDENLAWKEIAARFSSEMNKTSQVPALQMRYKRLREKMRVWTEKDVEALIEAREYWEKSKWDIIANRMVEFSGVDERWPAKYCLRKWELMHPGLDLSRERAEPVSSNPYAFLADSVATPPEFVASPAQHF